MKKIIYSCLLLTTATLANAVPNVWEYFDYQGFKVYTISSNNNHKLSISCNYAGPDMVDHGVSYNMNNKDYSNTDSKFPLSFLINDNLSAEPSDTTKWSGGSERWYKFTSAISKAKKIEVYYNNKKVSTIVPKNPNVVKSLSKCQSRLDSPSIG